MTPSITQIQEAIARTQEARERIQQHRSVDAIIDTITATTRNWLAPNSRWRTRTIVAAPGPTGFSESMISEAIDLTFGALTAESLGELLDGELGDRRVLNGFFRRDHVQTKATGPHLIAHFLAGNVPPPSIVSICCGLLLKSANLVKSSTRDPVFPALFVESLREIDAELADTVAVLTWPRAEEALTQTALAAAEAVIAYGDDDTIAALRKLARPEATFLAYGQKLSFAVVTREAMTVENLTALTAAAAFDVSVYDQQGCLSPHVFYVEEGGPLSPREFAAALAEAMATYQARVARGALSVEEAAMVSQVRQAYEFRAASDQRVAIWSGDGWTVIYEDDPSFTPSCLNRTVFVKPTDGLKRVLDIVQRLAGKISTVGLAPMNKRAMTFAGDLARMGVHRVCPIGQMQRPPLSWHHDGRPNLADLVRRTDVG